MMKFKFSSHHFVTVVSDIALRLRKKSENYKLKKAHLEEIFDNELNQMQSCLMQRLKTKKYRKMAMDIAKLDPLSKQ